MNFTQNALNDFTKLTQDVLRAIPGVSVSPFHELIHDASNISMYLIEYGQRGQVRVAVVGGRNEQGILPRKILSFANAYKEFLHRIELTKDYSQQLAHRANTRKMGVDKVHYMLTAQGFTPRQYDLQPGNFRFMEAGTTVCRVQVMMTDAEVVLTIDYTETPIVLETKRTERTKSMVASNIVEMLWNEEQGAQR